jgi:DNA-binding XRE family transcriptional regulator
MVNLKQQVKRLRKKRQWTQEDLAHEIGVSLSTVQRWERQGGKPIRLVARELDRLFTESSIVRSTIKMQHSKATPNHANHATRQSE